MPVSEKLLVQHYIWVQHKMEAGLQIIDYQIMSGAITDIAVPVEETKLYS